MRLEFLYSSNFAGRGNLIYIYTENSLCRSIKLAPTDF